MSQQDRAIPASLLPLLAQVPAELPGKEPGDPPWRPADVCRQEWEELMALQDRLIAEAELGVEYEAAESDPLLQRVVAGLDAEEVRWRDGARAIERQWLAEREAIIGWWRSDDAATLHKQVEAANRMADQLAESVSGLPPSRLSAERAMLSRALGLDALDAATMIRLCEEELGAPESPEATTAMRVENLLRACSCWGTRLAEHLVPTLERVACVGDDEQTDSAEEEGADGSEGGQA